MSKLKGITVTLYIIEEGEKDEFNHPTVIENAVEVENVLVSPVSSDDVLNTTSLDGRKIVYTLAIPKGDENTWENANVEFYGRKWRVVGVPLMGIEENIPLEWNKKVTVEAYE